MFDMSWGEVMLIGGVALVVIGPKDLPKALRTVGQVTAKLRRMASEFHMQFNEAIREAELEEVRREVDGIRSTVRGASGGFNPVQTIRDELKGAVEARTAQKPPASALADATADLKAAERAAETSAAPGSYDVPRREAMPPVPGSADDPFGLPDLPPSTATPPAAPASDTPGTVSR